MGRKKTDKPAGVYSRLAGLFRSKHFFYGILALAALQGIWYALSVQPTYFDEGRHLGFVQIYAENANPLIGEQRVEWDVLGDVTRDPAYLYYYMMGVVLRFVSVFTESLQVQIVSLRLVSLIFFVAGLVVYRKVLLRVVKPGASSIINLTLLFVVLTPAIAPLPGVVNYDSLIFLLSGILLLLALRIIQTKPQPTTSDLIVFLSLGLLGSIVKFTLIALFAPLALYIFYALFIRRKATLSSVLDGYKRLTILRRLCLTLLLLCSVALFLERPVKNFFVYHQVQPDCQKIIDASRCEKNYTAKRNMDALKGRPKDFNSADPLSYTRSAWIPQMIRSQTRVVIDKPTLPAMRWSYYVFTLLGGVLIIVNYKALIKDGAHRLLLVALLGYTFVLWFYNYTEYIKYGQYVAVTGRYLLPVLPIFIYFAGLSFATVFKKFRKLLLTICLLMIVLFSQGGGVISTMLTIDQRLYWPSARQTNENIREWLDAVVKKSG